MTALPYRRTSFSVADPPVTFSIRRKLFVLLAGLTTLVLTGVLTQVTTVLSQAILGKVRYDFGQTQRTFQREQGLRYDSLIDAAALIGENSSFKANVELADPASVYFIVEDMARWTRADLFIVTDADGKLLAWFDEPERHDEDLSHRESVARVLRGEERPELVNTPAFAGVGQHGDWGLRDAVVRLGRRKLGSLALQIKLINGLIKPEESGFDLRRFWVHSVGCAHIADKLFSRRLVSIDVDELSVNEYWVGALLHDIGKLVLGFFFFDHFDRLASLTTGARITFRDAEERLGDVIGHEQLGQLLLMRANMNEDLVRCVGTHHQPGAIPGALLALVNFSDNLCKDLGMGSLPDETAEYDAGVLRVLGVTPERVESIRESLGQNTVQEVMDIVERCTAVA